MNLLQEQGACDRPRNVVPVMYRPRELGGPPQIGDTFTGLHTLGVVPQIAYDPHYGLVDAHTLVLPWPATRGQRAAHAVAQWCDAWRETDEAGDVHGRLAEANRKVDRLALRMRGAAEAWVELPGEVPLGALTSLLRTRAWRAHAVMLVSSLPVSTRQGGLLYERLLRVPLPSSYKGVHPRHWHPLATSDNAETLDTARVLMGDGMSVRDALNAARALSI